MPKLLIFLFGGCIDLFLQLVLQAHGFIVQVAFSKCQSGGDQAEYGTTKSLSYYIRTRGLRK